MKIFIPILILILYSCGGGGGSMYGALKKPVQVLLVITVVHQAMDRARQAAANPPHLLLPHRQLQ